MSLIVLFLGSAKLTARFCLTGSDESFDEIQESDVIRSQPVGQIAFGVQSPAARLPEVAMVTGEEGEKHIVQVWFIGEIEALRTLFSWTLGVGHNPDRFSVSCSTSTLSHVTGVREGAVR